MHLHFMNVLDRSTVNLVSTDSEHAVDRSYDLARKDERHWAPETWVRAPDAEFGARFQKAHAAATDDLATYIRGPLWDRTQVELTLKLLDEADTPPFSISKLPPALEVAPEITLVAPPGTGKTTTVLQFARHVLASSTIVPLYFRLGDVPDGNDGLLATLSRRAAFKDVGHDDLVALAERGRLLLALDGWNELDAAARKRIRLDLDRIRLDWLHVRVVATTRRQVLDVPIGGPRIAIELLSEDQQMAIARAQSGDVGIKIVDDAWRTSGVRQLVATPLYLSVLLKGASRSVHPTTKEEVLRLFVEQHEYASEHPTRYDPHHAQAAWLQIPRNESELPGWALTGC